MTSRNRDGGSGGGGRAVVGRVCCGDGCRDGDSDCGRGVSVGVVVSCGGSASCVCGGAGFACGGGGCGLSMIVGVATLDSLATLGILLPRFSDAARFLSDCVRFHIASMNASGGGFGRYGLGAPSWAILS